jgi:hypothetical protein
MRSSVAICTFAVMTAVAIASPSRASAQAVDLTPFVGVFVPVSDYVVEDEFIARHKAGVAVGARVTYQTAGSIGFTAAGMYAVSDLEVEDEGETFEGSGNVLTFSGSVRYRLPSRSGIQPHITGGVAVLMRGGEFYDEFEWSNTTDIGGVIGAGIGIPFGERFRMAIDLEDFISSASVMEGSMTSQSRLQNDITLSLGLTVPVSGGR